MKGHIIRITIILIGLVCLSGLVGAQTAAEDAQPPLVILSDGDLWRWSGDPAEDPELFRTCQVPDEPVISVPVFAPDGRQMAFNTQPRMVREAAARVGYLGDDARPANTWVCDGEHMHQVAGQPDEASYFVDGVDDWFIVNSAPVWSPEGGHLAWTELRQADGGHWLTIANLATGISHSYQITADFPFGNAIPLDILWGTTGIYLRSLSFPRLFLVYDQSGSFARTLEIPQPADFKDLITRTIMITHEGTEYIGLHWHYGGWALLDRESGDMQMLADLEALPERYHPASPEGTSLLLVSRGNDFMWWVARPENLYVSESGHTRAFDPFRRDGIALSPSGDIATMQETVLVWRDGEEAILEMAARTTTSSPVGVSWGPIAWRVAYRSARLLGPGNTCPNLLVSRLAVNGLARVLPGDPNTIREWPDPDANRMGAIPPTEVFEVLAGPICGYDLAWWQVHFGDLLGWTAEGQGDVYWLEPLP